jgi:hypothetical protein
MATCSARERDGTTLGAWIGVNNNNNNNNNNEKVEGRNSEQQQRVSKFCITASRFGVFLLCCCWFTR